VSLVNVVCCQVEISATADHSSSAFLPRVVCLTECDVETSTLKRPRPTQGSRAMS
jgi:hypothetical protein